MISGVEFDLVIGGAEMKFHYRAFARITLFIATALLMACGGNPVGTQQDADQPDPDGQTHPDGGPLPDSGLPPECDPQEAQADGPCNAEVPGIKWDGAHCVALGYGCECVGADCGNVYETVADCVAARLGCYTVSCEAAPVSDYACIDCLVSVYLGTFWDGMGCQDLWGCECHGDGCDAGFASMEECEAVQASCEASLCQASGGQWLPDQLCGPCGHYYCGTPSALACCDAGCDCGQGQTFVPGVGCQTDPSCTAELACLATHGTWHPQSECICGFTCGQPNDCEACLDSCDCGPYRNFDPQAGCQWDGACGTPTQADRCEATGGIWHLGDGCGHFTCGEPNLLDPCVMPGCNCGAQKNFDNQAGCIYDPICLMPGIGETCLGWGDDSSCRPGLVCCESCGTIHAPCFTCQVPCCADNPECGPDGCYPPPV
jgi:hypothetical protein